MLARSGIQIIKYWFSVSDNEQEARFESRINDPLKQWKLSPMDLESRRRWEAYTQAKEVMLERTHIPSRPGGSCARRQEKARLNCITHLLDQVPYLPVDHPEVQLPERVHHQDYCASRARSTCSCRTAIELAGACLPTVTFRRHHPDPRAGRNARHCYAMSADHDDDIDGSRL